jgi:hypothetical protein
MAEMARLFEVISEDDMRAWQLWVTEWRLWHLEAYAQRTGCLGNITVLHDLTSPKGLLNMWMKNKEKNQVMRQAAFIVDAHYPGIIGKVMLVNAPWVACAILRLISTILPARLIEKIELLSSRDSLSRLSELIEPSCLPCFLGGEAVDEEFVPNRCTGFDTASCAPNCGETLDVPAGGRHERCLMLEAGELAAFGLRVEGAGQDIMFSCWFQPEGGAEVEQVRNPSRVEDSGGSSFAASRSGTLVLSFDNSYSWINDKTIHFQLDRLSSDLKI